MDEVKEEQPPPVVVQADEAPIQSQEAAPIVEIKEEVVVVPDVDLVVKKDEEVVVMQEEVEDDDGFGDFEEPKPADATATDGNDDFGDFNDDAFGDFNQETTVAVVEIQASEVDSAVDLPPTTIAQPVFNSLGGKPARIEEEEERISNLLKPFSENPATNNEALKALISDLSNLFPITCKPASYDTQQTQSQIPPFLPLEDGAKIIQLSDTWKEKPWAQAAWLRFQNENIYTDTDSFRWRKSLIRTAFIESISTNAFDPIKQSQKAAVSPVPSNPLEAQIKRTAGSPLVSTSAVTSKSIFESNNSTTDSREDELIAAKKLCDVSEDDLRKKSKAELREFIGLLTTSLGRMQEQANYWLDSKEQLIMESEMHNKMIASLVTYAKEKHSGAPAKKK